MKKCYKTICYPENLLFWVRKRVIMDHTHNQGQTFLNNFNEKCNKLLGTF